jgi:hypothetical protein
MDRMSKFEGMTNDRISNRGPLLHPHYGADLRGFFFAEVEQPDTAAATEEISGS